jgi:tetratricopeptide (TPR) repeat protein
VPERSESIESWSSVLKSRPDDAEALAALEALMALPGSREAAARALLPAYEAAGDTRKRVEALRALGEAGAGVEDRVAALQKAASLYAAELRQPELAFSTLAGALKLKPADVALRDAARKAADEADAVDVLVELLGDLLDGAPAPLRTRLRHERAELLERKLGDRLAAVKELYAVQALDPDDVEALTALVRLHRAGEEWAALVEALERLVHLTQSESARAELWREVGQVYEERLGDPERAAAAYWQVAELDSGDRPVAAALERLFGQLNRPKDLAFALELRRAQEGQGAQAREAAFRLARVKRELLADHAAALQLLQEILAEDPAHIQAREALEEWVRADDAWSDAALAALDPLLAARGEHARRVALRELRVSRVETPAERLRLTRDLAAIYEKDMGQPDRAFLALVRGFEGELDRAALRPELERLAELTDAREVLAELYEGVAGERPDDAAMVPLWRRAGELREALGETDEAIRDWRAVQLLAKEDPAALDALGRLYEKSRSAHALAEVNAERAARAQAPEEKAGLLLQSAAAYEAAGEDDKALSQLLAAQGLGVRAREVLGALGELYGKLRRVSDQAQVLAQLAETAATPGERRDALVQRAQLFERAEDAPEAVRAWAAVLAVAPADPAAVAGLELLLQDGQVQAEAAALLEPAYRASGDDRKRVELLELRLNSATAAERVGLLEQVSALRSSLGQLGQGYAAQLRVFAARPEVPEVRAELERLAAAVNGFEELAAAYEDAIERGGIPPAVVLELWRRLGALYAERLDHPGAAIKAWTEVVRLSGHDASALDALAQLYRRTHDVRALADVLWRQAQGAASPREKTTLLYELGALAEETLADKPLAARCYEAILAVSPEEPTALKALGRALVELDRYAEAADLLEREAAVAEARGQKEEALELRVRLGRLKVGRLGDARGGLQLYEAVLRVRPNHPSAVGALEELARSDNALRGEAAAALEPIFQTGGDHLKLVQVLESRAGTAASPAERSALLCRVGELYAGALENPESGFLAATRALRANPEDVRALELCTRCSEKAGTGEELMLLLAEVAPEATSDEARVGLFRALGRLQLQHGDPEDALKSFARLLELAPLDAEALGAVTRLYAQGGRAAELMEVLKRQLARAERADDRATLLFQMGVLQEDEMRDAVGALATFRRVLELHPDAPATLERMDGLAVRLERWPELADVLSRRVQLLAAAGSDAELLSELRFRLAGVREARLLDRPGALQLYAEVLAADPDHAGALGRLEVLCQKEPHNREAVELLLQGLRRRGEHGRLAAVLDARAGVSEDARERKALLQELSRLRDLQDEPELAFLALYRAFKEDPNDSDLRKRLEGLADAAKAWDELASAYEQELPRVAESVEAAEMCLKLGQLLDQRLDEPARAVGWLEKARTLDPRAAARALPVLDRLYNKLDRPQELASVLEALAESTADRQERVGLLFRLGQLAEGVLGSPDRAAAAYEEILQLDGRHLASARLLEQIYAQAGATRKLYEVLKLQEGIVSGVEKDRVLARMAELSADALSDVDRSVEIYLDLLRKNPRNEQAFASLDAIYEKSGRYPELKGLLRTRITQTLDPRELLRLNERLGRVLWTLTGEKEEAVSAFKAALEREPRHRPALDALAGLYAELGWNDDLSATLRKLLPLEETPAGVKGLRVRLAEVLATAGRREEALESGRRALEVEPHLPAELDRLTAVFRRLKALADAVRTLHLRSDVELQAGDTAQAVRTLFEVVALWREEIGKPEHAGPVYGRILEVDPANRAAYEQACALYEQLGDWRSWAQVKDQFLTHLVTDGEKVDALRELSRVQEQKLGQKHLAFMSEMRALQVAPDRADVREAVERLADETRSHEELAAVYEALAESLPRGPLVERLYRVLARVQDQKLNAPEAAEAALRQVLQFDPANAEVLDELAELFRRRGRTREFAAVLEQKVETAPSLDARKALLRTLAGVYEQQLSAPDEAVQALQRALSLETDRATLDQLMGLYRRLGRNADVAGLLERARDLAGAPSEQGALQLQLAQFQERELQDDAAALRAYQRALEFEPGSRDALAALERLLLRLDRPAEMVELYERQAAAAPDDRARVALLLKCAELQESRLSNPAAADALLERALGLEPGNAPALKALARLRRQDGRWEELASVLARHAGASGSPVEKAALLCELGEVCREQLRHPDRAAEAYAAALEQDARCRPALKALAGLYERTGNWQDALEMLRRDVALAPREEAVELHHRVGRLHEEMLQDRAGALAAYEAALAVDPGYLPSLRALKGLHEAGGDLAAYEQALVREANHTEDPQARAAAMVAVARFLRERKLDESAALPWFEAALKLDGALLEAAQPLADRRVAEEDWLAAEPLLDVVVQGLTASAAGKGEEAARALARQYYRLGYAAEKLGKQDKALSAYEQAWQLDGTYLPVMESLGGLLGRVGRHEDALKVLQGILLHHREELTDLEVVELYAALGELLLKTGQAEKAQNHFEKGLVLDPAHEPSLRALAALHGDAGRADRAAEMLQALARVVEGDARFEALLRLGTLAREQLKDPFLAIDALAGASRIHPDDLEVLEALLSLYRATRQGARAVEVLERLLMQPAVRADGARMRRTYLSLGEVLRDDVKDVEAAASAFNAALDLDHRFVEAFGALEQMLASANQWKALEDNYARMLHRFPRGPETHAPRMAMWRALGELYLHVLKNREGAFMAFQVVSTGLPDDVQAQLTFAELATERAGEEDKAVAAWRRALPLAEQPGKVASQLMELAARRKDYDAAWLAANVVTDLLGEGGAGEKEILGKLGPWARKRESARGALTDRLWQAHLFHPRLRGPLAELLALLNEQVGAGWAAPLDRHGLNKRHRVDTETAQEFQVSQFRYVSRLLGVESVELYSPFLVATRERLARKVQTPEPAPDLQVLAEPCNTWPPAIKVGGRFFGEVSQKETAYQLGRTLALLRPELALAVRLGAERLETVLQAAISLGAASFRYHFTADPRLLDAERRNLERLLTESGRTAVARLVQAYLRAAGPSDVRNYLEAVELTSVRAGLLACGDLGTVKRAVMAEPDVVARVPSRSKIRDLLVFALSEDLPALRAAVGTNVEVRR